MLPDQVYEENCSQQYVAAASAHPPQAGNPSGGPSIGFDSSLMGYQEGVQGGQSMPAAHAEMVLSLLFLEQAVS